MIKFLKNLTVNFLFTLLPLFIFTGSADLISEFSVFSLTMEDIFLGVIMNTLLMLPVVYMIKYIIKLKKIRNCHGTYTCLIYTSEAADE